MDLNEDAPKRRRGAELEQALLVAAWDQLLERGYAAFTMEAVADRAQTSRAVLYRRWPDKNSLVRAAIGAGVFRERIEIPDTGSLRDDLIELLRRSNAARAPLIPLMSVLVGTYFSETGVSFADLRDDVLGRGPSSASVVFERAAERGEIDPAILTPRVVALPFDLFRHRLLLTLRSVPDEEIIGIVDEIVLPLVRHGDRSPERHE